MALLGLSVGLLLSAYTDMGFVGSMIVVSLCAAIASVATQRRSFNK